LELLPVPGAAREVAPTALTATTQLAVYFPSSSCITKQLDYLSFTMYSVYYTDYKENRIMAQVNIRIDDDLKTRADSIFEELGINMTTAFTMFIRQTIRQGGIPFEITTRTDPFYSEENMKIVLRSIKEAEEGKVISKTWDELRAMEK
jgi:DNA-damage-inducible protein J